MNRKVRQCLVPYCGNNSFKTPDKVFISTPSNPVRRQEWFAAASNAYNKRLRVLTSSYCCEDHFNPITDFENWMEHKTVGTRLKVRSNVLPHLFNKTLGSIAVGTKPILGSLTQNEKYNSNQESDFKDPSGSEITNKTVRQMRNVSVQTNIPLENIETDVNTAKKKYEIFIKKLATGHVLTVSNISVIDKICTNIDDEPLSSLKNGNIIDYCTVIEKQSHFYLGISKDHYFLVKLLTEKINCPSVNVLITLKKIRLNDPFDQLTRDFLLPETSVRQIFISTVPKMTKLIKQFTGWPDQLNTLLHLPVQFRTSFINVQSIINFFEIRIEKPATHINRSLSWSKYKKIHTMKYLISVNPDGLINFISPGYGGRTSPIEIIKNCEYLDVLPHNSTILTNINLTELTTLLDVKNCKLITNITANEQLTEQAAKDSKQITALMKQIDTAIYKLSEFQILNSNSCIERSCIHLLDFIVIISCGLVNLQESAS